MSLSAPLQGGAAEQARRIERWLLSDEVILRGPHDLAGGVVNYITADGGWDGVYPEICGYHLQFLAAAAPPAGPPGESEHSRAARRVVGWLAAACADGAPLTLYRRDPALRAADWRNRCVFAFDLAIILRGLSKAEARWPGVVPAGLRSALAGTVRGMTEGARLASHRRRGDGTAVPVKWSTTPGVHHVKAAAALAGAGDPALEGIACETAREEAVALDREGHARLRELHPFLYLVEGWLTFWGQTGDAAHLRRAAEAFAMLSPEFDPATGVLPPLRGARDQPVRSDVLAQALRAGLVLDAAGALEGTARAGWMAMRAGLQEALAARVTDRGVFFDLVRHDRNTWASMFAWQALRFAEAPRLDAWEAAAELI